MNNRRFAEVVLPNPLRQSFTYEISTEDKFSDFGFRVRVPFGRRECDGWIIAVHENPPEGLHTVKTIVKAHSKTALFGEETLALAKFMSSFYLCSLGEALAAILPGAKLQRTAGFDETEELVLVDDPALHTLDKSALSQAQVQALSSLENTHEGMAYLYGVTGSGKTEVFLNHAEKILNSGRSVIYLVPEISLTRQLLEIVEKRFPNQYCILHSRLTPSQRLHQWQRIRSGKAYLVLGARSAIFAPVQSLGLIIIDEEHEASYKSGSVPRYHARHLAMHRVAKEKALLLMGSATPSLEAWKLMQEGKIKRLTLPDRVSGGSLPKLELVHLNGPHALSPRLIEEIQTSYSLGAQTILFLNRRGFSHFAYCQACNKEVLCRRCSVPLTYHKGRDRLVCHYCGVTQVPQQTCAHCNRDAITYAGFGTEYVEEETRKLFPFLRIARLDTDSVSKKGSLETTLADFKAGHIDLLLGTQMIAKGLNFPGLRLVGVILADAGLHMPDFRAAEKTYALLQQVAGRAGRFRDDGLVLLQAAQPSHPVLHMAMRASLPEFYLNELEQRKLLAFPPYRRLIRLVFRSKDMLEARKSAHNFIADNKGVLSNSLDVLGPAECPIFQINGSYRVHIILSSENFSVLHSATAYMIDKYKLNSKVYLELDIDPSSML